MGLFDAIGGALGISGDSAMLGGLGLFNGIMGMNSQSDTNAQSMQMFYGNQDFQREMRDTQYQSAVKDLSAAGLNPMLAGKVGGNMASGGSSIPSLQAPYGAGMQSALTSAAVAKTKADTEASLATAHNQQANADVTNALGAIKVQSEIDSLQSSATSQLSQAQVNRKTLDLMELQMDKIAADTQLSTMEFHKVNQEVANAVYSGELIRANTGNVKMDTALKQAQSALYDVNAQLGRQQVNFNVLDLPRAQRESSMHQGFWGAIVPYLNSAGKAVDTLGKGIQLMPK